jgi:radical SAM superfamily enzyme YgiQ (UPF0313 family)
MPLRIGFFQFELSHPNNAPHIGMCLIAPDLVADGHEVEAYLVGVRSVPDLVRLLADRRYDLVGIDSIFPIDVVNELKDTFPDLPLVVGGVNALALFLSSAADLAVVGPGRRAIRALAASLAAAKAAGVAPDIRSVPNLFFRVGPHDPQAAGGDGVGRGALAVAAVARPIDHSGTIRKWDVEEEVLPYAPLLEWGYLGSGRDPGAGRRLLSLVPEFGCPYQEDALAMPSFAGVERGESPAALLAHLDLRPRAVEAMRPFLANNGGCSFCVFRFQDYTLIDVERTVDILLVQVRELQARVGVRDFSLQTENPFRLLRPFLSRLVHDGIPVERLAIRTIATILLAKVDEFRRALAIAQEHGIQIVLQQIGFENFDQEHLDLFNKGITVAENRRAARLLSELKAEFGDAIEPFSGHGLILFDPWTTLESLERNIAAIEADAPYLKPAIGLQSKLVFYDPFNPIFRRARNDGLVVPSPHDYGWDFRFADPRTTDFVQMCLALERHLAKRVGDRAGGEGLSSRGYRRLENELFRRALTSYQAAGGRPERQREGFFEVAHWIDGELSRS